MQYTTASGDTLEHIERYLGFSAHITESIKTKHGKTAAIIAMKPEDANWQTMRLSSGMMGGNMIYDTIAPAREVLHLLQDCG